MKPKSEKQPLRVGMISLGCAKNLVDAEIMLGSLLKAGVEITNDAAQADAVIVNTCSFIDSAQEESVDTIFESVELREAANRGQAVIVSGCLPQRFRDDLPKLMPEVDAFMGIDQVAQVRDIVGKAIAARSEKSAAGQKAKGKGQKEKVAAYLNTLEKNRPLDDHEKQNALRGTEQFGKTKTVVGAKPSSILHPPSSPLLDVTARPVFIPDFGTPRFRLTPKHFAYLKIAEGCNHPCSFCIIPRMRGSHRSRTQADIVKEAKALIADGVKEINLISQDSTYYGLDLRPNHSRAISSPEKFSAAAKSLAADATTICTLLRELNALKGDFWIRLLYTHPAHWTDELIATIAACKKVARYLDIPLQHIHGNMLERMRRETSQQYIVDLIARIRAGIPGIALRTTFIVGFPGETEASFQTLLDFIRETKFERLGVFAYSQEDGTRAGAMSGQLADKVKQKRRELAMAAQHKVAVAVSESFVGREIKVLVEGAANAKQLQTANVSSWEHGLMREIDKHVSQMKGSYLVGRGEADAPDIDGRVYVRGKLPVGEFARVRIIGHTDYDLIAEPSRLS
ncbi:MAG: 30S ribosomal protein S12 methylthiotransferase RimO [Verrucomicrobia bacterium]|nr:30S ribosomal protein S12 methylthiotransferase RimO [Verrucomicrobiota bacterium]